MKKILYILIAIALLVGGYYLYMYWVLGNDSVNQAQVSNDYKDAGFIIEGQLVHLENSAAKYFGNEIKTDLDGDGDEDVAFIITHEPGGSGTFFYAVAALKTPQGYAGSDGYLLGDRIAPQNTLLSQNPRHQRVVVFNYADRSIGQPLTEQPSENKSVYLKIDPITVQWAIVEPDFEGESS